MHTVFDRHMACSIALDASISPVYADYSQCMEDVLCLHCQVPLQVVFAPQYAVAFALAPRVCHAFVSTLSGLTGEALSDALVDLDAGKAPVWDKQNLPESVLAYWGLPENASMRSVLLVMRADVNARMIINQGADFKTLSLVRHSCQ